MRAERDWLWAVSDIPELFALRFELGGPGSGNIDQRIGLVRRLGAARETCILDLVRDRISRHDEIPD
jgi:hypothetical protein